MAAPWLGYAVRSGVQPGGVILSISQAPLVPALGTHLRLGQEVVGDVLLGCLLEKREAAVSAGWGGTSLTPCRKAF